MVSRVVKYQDEEDTKYSAAKKLKEGIKKNVPDYDKKITAGERIPPLNFEEALGLVFKIVTESLQSEVQIQDFRDWFEELATG